jgi:hypothetical protein
MPCTMLGSGSAVGKAEGRGEVVEACSLKNGLLFFVPYASQSAVG